LGAAIRMASQVTDARPMWLVVDGALDAASLEKLNSVLDDNKKLYLENGEVISLKEKMNIVLVLDEASAAGMSPASVSRLGWVNFNSESRGWFGW